jgi:hypothetical protein
LLKRVFAVDVMVCSRCDGPMKVLAFLEEPTVVKGILTHLGLPASAAARQKRAGTAHDGGDVRRSLKQTSLRANGPLASML